MVNNLTLTIPVKYTVIFHMEIQNYINEKKNLQTLILELLEDEKTNSVDLTKIIDLIIQQKESYCEFIQIIQMLLDISINHYRNSTFLTKIYMIFQNLENLIKETFSNLEIFNLFKRNKLILLLFLKKKNNHIRLYP